MKPFDFSSLSKVNQNSSDCHADIRIQPDHFRVTECLPFKPDGDGGHVWLKIRKTGINTDWLASALARFANVKPVAVGYAGLKDRHAVTVQWFSVNLEGHNEPDWSAFETEHIQIIEKTRHGKKLKKGVLSGNQFVLLLSNLTGKRCLWEQALQRVKEQGVPNYFGQQRFGHDGSNLQRVADWFETGKAPRKRNQKSIYLSAARSWLFNQILSVRVSQHNWNQAMPGDVMLLSGTKASTFLIEKIDSELQYRLDSMDIHPTGPLWGRGEQQVQSDCAELENLTLACWQTWQQGLEKAGLKQERRSLRLYPQQFTWEFIDKQNLRLSFFLPAGSYATSVMRELAEITDVTQRNQKDDKVFT